MNDLKITGAMRTATLFLALIGVMGMSCLVLNAQKSEANVRKVCSKVDAGSSVFHFATDEVFFITR